MYIIKPVDHATPWMNNFVIVNKNNLTSMSNPQLWHLFGFLQPQSIHSQRTDDIFHKLSQAKMFTILDFSKGCYHMELDDACSFITTFNTPFCRFRSTRMPFLLTVAGDILQCKLGAAINNHYFCISIADDMII